MGLLHKAPAGQGYHAVVADNHPSLDRIRISVLRLAPGENFTGETGAWESALVLQAGEGIIAVESHGIAHHCRRQNVFAGPSSTVFVAPEQTWEVRAQGSSPLEVVVCSTPGKPGMASQVITADQLKVRKVGQGNWFRTIYDVIDAPFPAHTMVLGETYNPPGFWSSAPPHKHEVDDPPHESLHEEAYFFRLNPARGFGMQRVYTDDRYARRGLHGGRRRRGRHPARLPSRRSRAGISTLLSLGLGRQSACVGPTRRSKPRLAQRERGRDHGRG